jgi:hypothetical protein
MARHAASKFALKPSLRCSKPASTIGYDRHLVLRFHQNVPALQLSGCFRQDKNLAVYLPNSLCGRAETIVVFPSRSEVPLLIGTRKETQYTRIGYANQR